MGRGRTWALWIAGLVCLFGLSGASAPEQDVQLTKVFEVKVIDQTGVLTQEQVLSLVGQIEYLELRAGVRFGVLITASGPPQSMMGFAMRLAEALEKGAQVLNDGAILVVTTQNPTTLIQTGRGFGGRLPEALTKRIIAETIDPRLKEGDTYQALSQGIGQFTDAVIQGPGPEDAGTKTTEEPESDPWLWVFVIAGIVAGVVLFIALHRHGFICGLLGLVAAAGLVWLSDRMGLDILDGLLGGGLLFLISTGPTGWWIIVMLVVNIVFEGGGGGGGGGGGLSGGGGGFGGGGASGSW